MTTIFRWYNPKCLKIIRKEYCFYYNVTNRRKKNFLQKVALIPMSISMFNWFCRCFFVWVLRRFIHPKPLRKTRFYDDRDLWYLEKGLSFWNFGNWICILYVDIAHIFAYHDSLRPKITENMKKWKFERQILSKFAI